MNTESETESARPVRRLFMASGTAGVLIFGALDLLLFGFAGFGVAGFGFAGFLFASFWFASFWFAGFWVR